MFIIFICNVLYHFYNNYNAFDFQSFFTVFTLLNFILNNFKNLLASSSIKYHLNMLFHGSLMIYQCHIDLYHLFYYKQLIFCVQDLKEFVDNATNGFIYFSMGHTVNFSLISNSIQEIFYDVFEKLPYKIVWKYEKEPLRKIENAYITKWLPQKSVLGIISFIHRRISYEKF